MQAEPYNYKLKGVKEPKYHLGANFFREGDGTLCCGVQTYIKRLMTDGVLCPDVWGGAKDSVYSSIVSLRSLHIICLIAELNGLILMAADVGNAYLEAHTKEKICFIAGPEFKELVGHPETKKLAGHTMVMSKALYGLKSSGARFHTKFADTLREFGFKPTYADPDVWIRDAGDVYKYVGVYVDDLLVAMKEPEKFFEHCRLSLTTISSRE